MNKRIRELDNQAHQLAVIASKSHPHICAVGSDYFNALEKEKFAELIVKECTDAIELNTMQIPKRSISEIRTILRKHFGVEE